LEEVKKLRSVIAKSSQRSSHTKVGTCIMVSIAAAVTMGRLLGHACWMS